MKRITITLGKEGTERLRAIQQKLEGRHTLTAVATMAVQAGLQRLELAWDVTGEAAPFELALVPPEPETQDPEPIKEPGPDPEPIKVALPDGMSTEYKCPHGVLYERIGGPDGCKPCIGEMFPEAS